MDVTSLVPRIKPPAGQRPDFSRFVRAVTTGEPGPVPIGDLFADFETVGNYLGEKVYDHASLASDPNHKLTLRDVKDGLRFVDQTIRFCLGTGWDYAFAFSSIPFPGFAFHLADNTSPFAQGRKRTWIDDNRGAIGSWQDFETYAWPSNPRVTNLMSRLTARRVPEGMKVMVIPGGVFEWTTWLMGLVPFCYALADQPDLVDAVIDRVSVCIYAVVEDLMDEPNIGGIFMGDDLGYASGTMVAPRVLRTRFFPHTRRIVDLVHGAGKVFCLHTCGNVYGVMDDLIGLGIDAKHSFEDKIMPVEEVYRRWGQQVALIGGLDVHLLASGSEQDVRRRTREILEVTGLGGHYVLGTGNSVANYIPMANYLAMIDEGRRWNREHLW